MSQRVQNKRGLKTNLPNSGMLAGELHLTTDRHTGHFALDADTNVPLVPAIDDLVNMGAVDSAADLLIVHDADATGVREKRISITALRAALNIPAGSTDELVAVVNGGTSGYLYGTDGTDGVVRLSNSLSWALDPGNGFVTLDVDVIDCGTF